MYRGHIDTSSNEETEAFDNINNSGIYSVVPPTGTWSTLIVFTAFTGASGIVQLHFYIGKARYRIRNSNTNNTWTEWKTF